MRWFQRRKHREAALQARVSALQASLDNCKDVAEHSFASRRGATAVIAAIALATGFALGVYHKPIARAGTGMAVAIGLAKPDVEAAGAAYAGGDYAAAFRLAKAHAQEGDPRAQSLLGLMYSRGRGAPQNEDEALKWLRRAADQGDAAARFNLGLMAQEGRGMPQDHGEAAKWYRLAAEQGYASAQYNLGLWYAEGEIGARDNIQAHMWFNLAAARFPASDTRNRAAAARNRDLVAGMMTAEQIAQAQQLAREWNPK